MSAFLGVGGVEPNGGPLRIQSRRQSGKAGNPLFVRRIQPYDYPSHLQIGTLVYYSLIHGGRVFRCQMRFSENPRAKGYERGWQCVLIAVAICSLTLSLATRFSIPLDASPHAVKCESGHSGEPKRLDRDAATYVAPVLNDVGFDSTPVDRQIIASAPARPRDVLSLNLYNRPPPFSPFI